MEMIPMMTQPQDLAASVSATAVAVNAPQSPRLSAAPLFLEALMQEMLPASQPGAEPVAFTMSQALIGKVTLSGKGKTAISPANVPGDGTAAVSDSFLRPGCEPAGPGTGNGRAAAGRAAAAQIRGYIGASGKRVEEG